MGRIFWYLLTSAIGLTSMILFKPPDSFALGMTILVIWYAIIRLGGRLLGFFATILCILTFITVTAGRPHPSAVIFMLVPTLLLLTIVIISKLSIKYAITERRVLGRSGIFSEDFKSVTFTHITSLYVRHGILGRLLRFGDIVIDTSGSGSRVEFVWRYVKNPINVKNTLEARIK